MKLGRRLILVMIALCGAAAVGWLVHRSGQRQQAREQAQLAAVFAGDAVAFERLRGSGARAVGLIEEFIQRRLRADPAQIEKDIAHLASENEAARRWALARLTLLPEPATDLLRACHDRATNAAAKELLKPIVVHRLKGQEHIAGFLSGLYSEHCNRLFASRRAALMKDCQDVPAQLFFAYAPFEQVWSLLKNSPSDAQLRFLLLRLYTERDAAALEHLESFPAADILRVAAQTWWPVELQAPAQEGALTGTTRAAALSGNTATHLLRLSARSAAKPGAPDPWLHLDRWLRWTYAFASAGRGAGTNAVVFAEDGRRKLNLAGRTTPSLQRDKPEGKLWLPDSAALNVVGPGRCEVVHGVPAPVRVPFASLSRTEEARWRAGTVFEWARPLFSPAIQARLQFAPNEFPPPAVVADPEGQAKQNFRSRGRRKR